MELNSRNCVNILKAERLILDYMVTSEEQKPVILDLLENYIRELDDPHIQYLFLRLREKESIGAASYEKALYADMLVDIIAHWEGEVEKKDDPELYMYYKAD